ncbi:MAG: hypothetical protein JWL90_1608 [Chthoniobacteraceae bacterium]|nr:hypothetical protein [Chthoniobacteraceae bacterium]
MKAPAAPRLDAALFDANYGAMSFLDRFRKKPANQLLEPGDHSLRQNLVNLILGILTDKDGRIHAEDAISAAATVVGERCIDAAGDFALRDHEFTPGSRVFSTKVNKLICGDVAEGGVSKIPKDSIVGMLRSRLDARVYTDADFPALSELFKYYAAYVGKAADWGKVPLSVGEAHLPFIPPLRVGYETRVRVDEVLYSIRDDKPRCLRIATESLAEILTMVASAIDRKVALTLALETINGMSKTASMTIKAMQPDPAQKTG